jgi:hypothetical protein
MQGSVENSVVQGLEVGKRWHRRELNAVDWSHDQVNADSLLSAGIPESDLCCSIYQIMTCSDDCSTRIWRPSRAAYDAIAKDPQDASYDWSGVNV